MTIDTDALKRTFGAIAGLYDEKLLATFAWMQTAPEDARATLFRGIDSALAHAADPLPLHMHTLLVSAVASLPDDSQYQGL
jgi:hypothetical protein